MCITTSNLRVLTTPDDQAPLCLRPGVMRIHLQGMWSRHWILHQTVPPNQTLRQCRHRNHPECQPQILQDTIGMTHMTAQEQLKELSSNRCAICKPGTC